MASKETEYRFLIVGKSGSGKSSTANTIMGKQLFTVGTGLAAGTTEPQYEKNTVKGLTFAIVDTPGLFDPEVPNEKIKQLIVKASACLSPGLTAVLYVLKVDRYTPEQHQTFMRLKELFDENIVNYTIVIFTGGDMLKKNKMTVDQLLAEAGDPFKEVMRECGNRMVVFNNEDKRGRDTQVKELLALVKTVAMNNDNKPYDCTLQQVVNTNLERRVSERTQERIQRDPKLKKVFDDMATHARQARESAARHHDEAEESLKKSLRIRKIIEEETMEDQEDNTAQKKAEQNRKAQEEREKQEQKQRDEEEKQRKSEEEKKRKEKEAEEKKKMKELQKELERLKIERETQLKLEAEKEKIRQEYEQKLETERKKYEKEETEVTKQDVVKGKETTWVGEVVGGVASVAGGLWKAAKGRLGF